MGEKRLLSLGTELVCYKWAQIRYKYQLQRIRTPTSRLSFHTNSTMTGTEGLLLTWEHNARHETHLLLAQLRAGGRPGCCTNSTASLLSFGSSTMLRGQMRQQSSVNPTRPVLQPIYAKRELWRLQVAPYPLPRREFPIRACHRQASAVFLHLTLPGMQLASQRQHTKPLHRAPSKPPTAKHRITVRWQENPDSDTTTQSAKHRDHEHSTGKGAPGWGWRHY